MNNQVNRKASPQLERIILSREQIHEQVVRLGNQITGDYQDRCPLLIGILNGAFIFLADLVRHIDLPLEIDFIQIASYGNSATSSGQIQLLKSPQLTLADKDVLIVEDIVDTGNTLQWLSHHLRQHHRARSVRVCALIDKRERRQISLSPDYVGFTIDSGFLVGYGLDCAQQYRNLADIWTIKL